MTAASLLVELNTEELPPKALQALSEAFAAGIAQGLRARGFLAAESRVGAFGAPRRLAVHITQVAARSPDAPFRQKLVPMAIGLDGQGNATPALLKKLSALGANVDHRQLLREHDGKQEVLVYAGVKAGVDPLSLWKAVRQGFAGRRRTFDGLAEQFLPGKFDPASFSLRLAHKDVALATSLGREFKVPMRLSNITLEEMTEAMNRGWGERDSRVSMLLQEERAGVEIHEPEDAIRQVLELEIQSTRKG